MEQVEVPLDNRLLGETLAVLIEACLVGFGLEMRMRGTLHTYPGSLHWHFGRPGERGTLEVTLWPAKQRLWFSIQVGRRATWIEDILPQIKCALLERIAAQ